MRKSIFSLACALTILAWIVGSHADALVPTLKPPAGASGEPAIGGGTAAKADIVVVTSTLNPVDSLSRDDVINIFMGRDRRFPDGRRAIPLDAPADSKERRLFYRSLLGQSPEQVKAYWSQLSLASGPRPPLPMPTIVMLLDRLADHSHMLGYIERRHLTRDLKVVFSLDD